jgi:hypothetical protein
LPTQLSTQQEFHFLLGISETDVGRAMLFCFPCSTFTIRYLHTEIPAFQVRRTPPVSLAAERTANDGKSAEVAGEGNAEYS